MGNVRLDRDVWRILVYRNRQYAEVTAEGGILEASSPQSDYEILSCGIGVGIVDGRRVVGVALIGGTGPGPDGSSLTLNYRSSQGSGVEKRCVKLEVEEVSTFVA